MSGLCGWIGAGTPAESLDASPDASLAATLERMADALPAIGPVHADHYAGRNAALRLKAIQGIGSWHRDGASLAAIEGYPRWTDDKLALLARERGHAAAVAAAWRERGPRFLEALHGAFALAVVDIEAGAGLIAIDRLGIHAMSYACPGGGPLVFGSTVTSVARHPSVGATVTPQAIHDFLFFVDRIPAPETIFAEQKKLLPGECLVFERGQARPRAYWRMPYQEDDVAGIDRLAEAMRQELRAAVRRTLEGEDPGRVGAFLSGGLDSSTVAGFLAEAVERPPRTYTIGFDVDGFDESSFARIAAARFATDHREYYMKPAEVFDSIPNVAAIYDEPFGNASALPTYICARRAAEDGTEVMLAGDGGDEIFAGNTRYLRDMVFDHYQRIPRLIRRSLLEPLLAAAPGGDAIGLLRRARNYVRMANMSPALRLSTFNAYRYVPRESVFSAEALAEIDTDRPLTLLESIYDASTSETKLKRILAIDLRITLADSDLRKVNRMCELAGVRVRYPFLDDSVVEFSGRVPADLLIRNGRLRHFYKEAMRDVLPVEIINKSKHGFGLPFVDFAAGHGPLRDLVCDSIAALKKRGFFSARWLDSFLDGDGVFSLYGGAFWDLMMLELWFENHVDRHAAAGATAAQDPPAPARVAETV